MVIKKIEMKKKDGKLISGGVMDQRGFTLLELLVVVTILVILTGAVLPFVQGYVDDSRYSKAKADLDILKNNLALYETRRGEPYSTSTEATSTAKLVNRGFITKNPVDPWGSPYDVFGARGEVVCRGPDGKANTADDIIVPYQPPLACTAAYWVDGDQDSMARTGGANGDYLVIYFTRAIRSPFPSGNTQIANGSEIGIVTDGTVGVAPTNFDWYDNYGKQGKLWWSGGSTPNFQPGQSVLRIQTTTLVKGGANNCTFVDYNNWPCKDDDVKIVAR